MGAQGSGGRWWWCLSAEKWEAADPKDFKAEFQSANRRVVNRPGRREALDEEEATLGSTPISRCDLGQSLLCYPGLDWLSRSDSARVEAKVPPTAGRR